MANKTVAAAKFKADCLRLIDEMGRDGVPVTVTKHGRPVAVLSPPEPTAPISFIGALKGTVLRYDDPFAPAIDPSDWSVD